MRHDGWLDRRTMRLDIFPWDAPRGLQLRRGLCFAALVLMLLALGGIASAQQSMAQAGNAANPTTRPGDLTHDPNSVEVGRMQEQMADRRNTERQKELVADTEKLYELAQQLRDEVAKSNKDQLSIPVVKRSEQIEKLARSIKEKMRGS